MPDRNNERGWIRHVLGKNLTEEQINASKRIHTALHEIEDDKTVTPKIKPDARKYLNMAARETLTDTEVSALEISHINLPEHVINPEDK